MPLPSFTPTFHRDTYPAIDPGRPALSAAGKTVIITGAGYGGIGASVVDAFAAAGATKIGIIGRTQSTLLETKSRVEKTYPKVNVHLEVADVTDAQSVGVASHQIRVDLGAWDIYVHAAGFLPESGTLIGSDFDDWWKGFEVNVKFSHHFAKHFLSKCRPNATFISLSSGAAHAPATMVPGMSAYSASKLAAMKLNEILAVQNPGLRVFTVHPGIVDTPMSRKHQKRQVNGDDPRLAGHFMVWLASSESEFLRGRFMWANWDVGELKDMEAKIEGNPTLLRTTIGGWPFEYMAEDEAPATSTQTEASK